MKLIDLTSNYIEHVLEKGDLRRYEELYPALFKHYFTYWASRNRFRPVLSKAQVLRKKNLVISRIPVVQRRLKRFYDYLEQVDIVLFVGQNTSNGHAWKDNKDVIVWIPIEVYSTPLQVDVFLTHEVIHALHYILSPSFYFKSEKKFISTSRQLITEGIATYLTKRLLSVNEETVLWADYLPKRSVSQWMKECRYREQELLSYIQKHFYASSRLIQLFQANDPKDLYSFRAGYFIGLTLIEKLARIQKLTPRQLLTVPRKEFERRIYDMIASRVK